MPDPMLARSGPLPAGKGWRYEPKLDGFRCLVCTHGDRFRAKSRRGWDMTAKLPELALSLHPDVQLDGELIAWSDEGLPDFHRLGGRMLHGDDSIPVTYMAFDLLALDGESTLRLPYTERHALLEEITIDGPPSVVEVFGSFDDGTALSNAIVERGLEGVVAKRRSEPYRPGLRTWVKTKNATPPASARSTREHHSRVERGRSLPTPPQNRAALGADEARRTEGWEVEATAGTPTSPNRGHPLPD